MRDEPEVKRVAAFFDGQNLFHAAKEAFGYKHPNFDPLALAQAVSRQQGWQLSEARFYTGVPDQQDNAFWNHFWTARLATMGRRGVITFSRPLRYRNETIALPDGGQKTILVGQEKGIDVRLAIDVVRLGHARAYDVALVFSQDQDLSEVADEIRVIGQEQQRWLRIACAFPQSPTSRNKRGINGTDWIRVDRETYDTCLDQRDYRPKTEAKAGPEGGAKSKPRARSRSGARTRSGGRSRSGVKPQARAGKAGASAEGKARSKDSLATKTKTRASRSPRRRA